MFPGKTKFVIVSGLCLLACLSGAALFAQTTGILEGLAFDPSGRIVPGAAVNVIDLNMGISRHLTTDQRGRFQALSLLPGVYRVEISSPGFRGQVHESVTVPSGGVVEVNFNLVLGEPQQEVLVVEETPLLSTRTSDWGGSIENQKLESYPLKGRDLFDLAVQTPGASMALSSKIDLSMGWGTHMSINGSRPNQNAFRLDGIYINDATSTAPASAAGGLLGIEGILELRVVNSPFSAEYGRASGALITAVSKSGSNEFHGSAYEFLRNNRLDARNFFDPAGEKTPPLRRNQFGASLGGPLKNNRIFFFVNYEGIRSTSSKASVSTTINEAARQGILPTATGVRTVVIAPEIAPYMRLYPDSNGQEFGDGTAEYLSQIPKRLSEDAMSGRVDYSSSEKLHFFSRYTFDTSESSTTDPFHIWTFPASSRYQFAQIESQYLRSAKTIHSFRAGFSRIRNGDTTSTRSDIPSSLSFVPGQALGAIDVTGLTSLGGMQARLRPRKFVFNDLQLGHDAVYILGSSSVRFGISFDRIQFNQRTDDNPIGRYSFSSLSNFLEGKTNFGDMMKPGSDSIRGWRQSQFSAFIQDERRITANLSVTLGLRYEGYTTPAEVNGKIATLPDPLHDSAVSVGGPLFENPSAKNFAPRAAIAWDPFGRGKTVVRAGAGVFFDLLGIREVSIAGARMPPFFTRVTMQRPSFPDLIDAAQYSKPEIIPNGIEFRPSQPYTTQLQLSIEQKMPLDFVARASYAGTRGVHLPGYIGNMNPPVNTTLEDGSLFFPEGASRINPAFNRIMMRRMVFNSFYHAFHLEVQRHIRKIWGFQMKYTWSKSIDETSSSSFTDFLTSDQMPTMLNYRQNRGLSDFDVRHLLAANISLRLPSWGLRPVMRAITTWEIHAMFQAQTGYPFSPFVGFDRARINPGSEDLGQRPNLAAAPGTRLILGNPQKYFDDQAFALPVAGQYGNLGRNTLTGPGLITLDLAIHKSLWRTERHNIYFRAEAFNMTNRPNFQVPSGLALFNSSLRRLGSAGRITSTSTPSRQIQFAVKWTY